MHEPTTVRATGSFGPTTHFNVGHATVTSEAAVFSIAQYTLILGVDVDRSEVSNIMQLFSDLLTDAGV